ncbi:hypothetical protein AAI421_17915 [Rhodococcus aetherivorans]|uniref:hypothetical protein n=1 Tax=Rhodococcus aetherivorans TaxID=191292 RepID=UPI0031D7E14F
MSADPLRDPADMWDPLPPAPPGFGPWELVDSRAYYRAWKDDLPVAAIYVVHGGRIEKRFYVAHYSKGTNQ